MLYRLTSDQGQVWEFTTRACAELYQRIYGGSILELEPELV